MTETSAKDFGRLARRAKIKVQRSSGGPGPLDLGETMIYTQRHAHDHRLPHLQRRWATRPVATLASGGIVKRSAAMPIHVERASSAATRRADARGGKNPPYKVLP